MSKIAFSIGKDKKKVVIRIPLIEDQKVVARNAEKSNSVKDPASFGIALMDEYVKLLLVSVNNRELKAADKVNLNDLFSLSEYNAVRLQVEKLVGEVEEVSDIQVLTE